MPDPFDTSSIPDDQAYWDALAQRVTEAAVRRPAASGWLTRGSAPWIAAASLACAASLVLALLSLRPTGRSVGADWFGVLAPRDAVGRSFASRESPPPIGELLAAAAAESRP